MKFAVDIPDEDVIEASAFAGLSFGPSTLPTIEEATAAIQEYLNRPGDKVKRVKVKQADPEVLAKAAEIEQKKQEYADLVAQKSGTPKDLYDSVAFAVQADIKQ